MLMHAKYNNNSNEQQQHSSREGSKLGGQPRKLSNGQEIDQDGLNNMIVPQHLEHRVSNMDLG